MNSNHILRLPASEYSKLVPARPRDHRHEQPVAEPAPQAADVVHTQAGQTRPAQRLSGFARA
jgi:hypothetical protein